MRIEEEEEEEEQEEEEEEEEEEDRGSLACDGRPDVWNRRGGGGRGRGGGRGGVHGVTSCGAVRLRALRRVSGRNAARATDGRDE